MLDKKSRFFINSHKLQVRVAGYILVYDSLFMKNTIYKEASPNPSKNVAGDTAQHKIIPRMKLRSFRTAGYNFAFAVPSPHKGMIMTPH